MEIDQTYSYILYVVLITFFIAIIICLTIFLDPNTTTSSSEPTNKNVTFAYSKNISPKPTHFNFPIYIINLDRKPERYIYVRDQLDNLDISNYYRVSAVDGFKNNKENLIKMGVTSELADRPGLAGCAASHINMWKYIAQNKMDWTLIVEDDVHFHPDFIGLFNEYWTNVPKDAKIIFLGFCADPSIEDGTNKLVFEHEAMCTHGYLLSWQGAQELIDNILPVKDPIDIAINNYFKDHSGSFLVNGSININGITPNDYKNMNGRKCMFNGIIYQNHEDQGSTIHCEATVF